MNKALELLQIAAKKLNDLIEILITIGLMMLFFIVTVEVFGRFVFRFSFRWIPELSGFLLAFIAYFGASCLVHRKSLMNIDFLYNKLPYNVRKVINIVASLLMMYYSYILVVYGYSFAQRALGQYTTSLVFRITHVRMIIPIGGLLILIQALNNLLQEMRKNSNTTTTT